jgi:hypothetical protein
MAKPYIFIIASLLISCGVSAQTKSSSVWDRGNKGVKLVKEKAGKKVSSLQAWKTHLQSWGLDSSFNHLLALGARLNSDGWSGGIVYGHRRNSRSFSVWQLTFSEVKEEKETKQQRTNPAFPSLRPGTPYIFGKINNLYLLHVGYGRQQLLLPAVLENNISIGFRYSTGFGLAMLKPYYLNLIYPNYSVSPATATEIEQSYNESNKEHFLNRNLIAGKGKWERGLNDIVYIPGLYAEGVIVIVPRKGKAFIQTITLGINGSMQSDVLPLVADAESSHFRGCLFAGVEIGKRW